MTFAQRPRTSFLAVFALMFLFTLNLQAQIPGYLGKRMHVGLTVMGAPATNVLSYGSSGRQNYKGTASGGDFFMNTTWQARFEYILGRSFVLGASASFFRTGESTFLPFEARNITGALSSTGGGVHFKWFPFLRKGALAPVGPFTELGFSIFHGTLKDGSLGSPSYNERLAAYIIPKFNLSLGYNYVLFDQLLLGIGIETAVAISTETNFATTYNADIPLRVFGHQSFNGFVALGFLF